MVAEIDEVLVRHRDETLVQNGQPADTRVENADRPRVHRGDRRVGLPCRPSWVAGSSFSRRLPLRSSGARSALAATPQQLTITASDGAKLACSLVEPDGTPPTGGWPAVMLFHGLGGRHEDMEPLATKFLAPAGYASLECDARGHGTSEGLFGLDGPRDVQDTTRALHLAHRPSRDLRHADRRARHLTRRRRGVERGDRRRAVQGDRPGDHLDESAHVARAAGPVEVRARAVPRRARADEPLGPAAPCSVSRAHHEHGSDGDRRTRRVALTGRRSSRRSRRPRSSSRAVTTSSSTSTRRSRRTRRCTGRSACTSAISATSPRRTRPPSSRRTSARP